MDFLDPATKCFAIYHPIPKKIEITIIMIIVITIVEMIITQLKKQITKPTRFTRTNSKETK